MSTYKNRRDKYIDLRFNGKLFPSWILANFKAYKLPEFAKIEDEDPCNRKSSSGLELRKYQQFLGKYLDFHSINKNILIYHGLGSGKTNSAINIYNVLYNASPGINVFLLIKASLKNSVWMKDLEIWLQSEEKQYRMSNIIFVSYDAPNADKSFLEAVKNADNSKRSLYIIDEAHNFIRNVYSNLSSKQGRRAQIIYEHMIQDQKENEGTRIVLLSGTPAINSPFELALLFNLLRPGIFSKSESQFNQEFISTSTYRTLNPAKKNLFQRRIMGLVSYYLGATPDYYASKHIEYVDVPMNKYQEEIYTYFENLEEQMARKKKGTQSSETYKSYTRQSCNFVFPLMGQGISGEHRPRPRGFKLSEKESQLLEKAKDFTTDKGTDKYYNVQNYIDAIDNYAKLFDNYLDKAQKDDEKLKHTILKDIETCISKYSGDFSEFHKSEKKKSTLYDEMHKCSAKFLNVIFNILRSSGPVLIYSNYVLMEGLQIFKIYLKYFGFSSLDSKLAGVDGFRYTEYHGSIDPKQRVLNLDQYNVTDNAHGKICKIMMISPAGAEGLNLKNVRQVHLMEPYWHEVRMIQMIGRAVRMCSHKDLPQSERKVDVFRYKSVRANGEKWTTDQYIEDLARGKEGLIQSFLDSIKEVAIDCVLNKNHNSLIQDYKCFQFDEPSLFDDQIGPAYKEDIFDDMRMDNGSNSSKSQTIRVKIIKIKAVKQLSAPDIDPLKIKYSKQDNYWYNPETGVVYDYELHFQIGKIAYDDDNLPKKLDKDTYIIDKLIPIPMIDEKEE
jgi:superfamily II DNA or RNA helicase